MSAFDGRGVRGTIPSDWRRFTRLVDLLMQLVYRDRFCMKRSLLHFYFMRKADMNVSIHFGVRKPDEQGLAGHAWVEIDGRPYCEKANPKKIFVETFVYPSINTGSSAS